MADVDHPVLYDDHSIFCDSVVRGLIRTSFRILFDNKAKSQRGVRAIHVDGAPVEGQEINLTDDGKSHEVKVEMGTAAPQ